MAEQWLTNKRPALLGVDPKRGVPIVQAEPGEMRVEGGTRLVRPGEAFCADHWNIPTSWLKDGWFVPATAEEIAAAKATKGIADAE